MELRPSKALLESAIKNMLTTSSDRKKTTIVALSGKPDLNGVKLDTSRRHDKHLMREIQSFVANIESGRPIDDAEAASAQLSNILGCDVKLAVPGTESAGAIFPDLVTDSESTIQESLRKVWISDELDVGSYVIDTHASNFHAPIFKFVDKHSADCGCINLGKSDFTSLAAPLFLEIKDVSSTPGRSVAWEPEMMNNEFEVLGQAIERVHVVAYQNELLRRIFSIASTGSRSWLVYCERSHPRRPSIQ